MNKEFEYKGYRFNINVELNTSTRNGTTYHTITTNCMNFDNYYLQDEIKDNILEMSIRVHQSYAEKYVDEKENGKHTPNQILTDLGFK